MKINIKKDEAVNSVAIFFSTVLIIRPQYFISAFPNSVLLFTVLQATFVVVISMKIKKIIMNSFLWCLYLFYFYDIVNTIFQNPAQINGAIVAGVWVISAVYIVTYYAKKIGIVKTISKFSTSLTILLWMNLLSSIIYPKGMITVIRGTGRPVLMFFLGQSNQLTSYYMLSIVLITCSIITLRSIGKYHLAVSILVIPMSIITIQDKSSTALICGLILIVGLTVYWFFPSIIRKIILNPITSISIIIIGFIGISGILSLNIVREFIINVLNKDVTLSERTTIWLAAYSRLLNPKVFLFGLGEASGGSYITIWTGHSFSAHNLFLQILLLGGIALFLLFVVMIINTVKRISKITSSKKKAIISICLLAFFFINLLEVYSFAIVVLTMYIFILTGICLETSVQVKD